MKRRIIILMFFLSGTIISCLSQAFSSDTLMKKVLENNRTLKVARESYRATILEAGTGNTPPDPEVEFGYLFGKPAEMGNRVDFSVTQQMDFPTVYIYKSRLRKIKTSQAELDYIISRQKILLLAKQLWIERVYLNQQKNLLRNRISQATSINEHFRQKLFAGEVGTLSYNQSRLQLVALEGEHEQVLSEIRSNQLAMTEISGGAEFEVKDTLWPPPVKIIPDSLLHAYMNGPELQLYTHELQLKEEQKNLSVSQTLPKVTTGYYSESVLDQQFKGFQVGVTIPLWENRNKIKLAKSEVLLAEADAKRYTQRMEKQILQQLDQLESLKSRAKKLEEALRSGKSIAILTLALNSGEISLSEYFYASDFYFRNQQQLLEYQRDQLLVEAELLKLYL